MSAILPFDDEGEEFMRYRNRAPPATKVDENTLCLENTLLLEIGSKVDIMGETGIVGQTSISGQVGI